MADPPFVLGHRPELDGLRAVAVIMILLVHLAFIWPSVGRRWFQGGVQGVDIFFVLSGFLLTSLLLQERRTTGGFSFAGFYRRRALRLLPALVFVILCNLLYTWVTGAPLRPQLRANVYVLLYIANWATVFAKHFPLAYTWDPTWSLAVEEQYYLIFFPFLVLLLRRIRTLGTIMVVLAAGIVAAVIWRNIVIGHQPHLRYFTVYVRTDTRIDALLFGPLAALALHRGLRVGRGMRVLGLLGAAFLFWFVPVGSLDHRWVYRYGFVLVDASAALIVLAVIGGRDPFTRLLRTRPMIWIGRRSYGIYLWNLPVYLATARYLHDRPEPLQVLVAVSITVVCAAISYRLVELPFLRRKHPGNRARQAPVNPGSVATSP